MLYRVLPASLTLAALLAGCAKDRPIAVSPPAAVSVPVRVAAPLPPDGAAATLTIPARLADGDYATPNRGVSAAGAVWHLRAAFNVAALNCNDATLAPIYNKLLATQRTALTTAHRTLAAEHGAAFDPAMTRLYNYFAQPPVMARFCAAATPLLHQAAALAPGTFADFAPTALSTIDRPFRDFFARYDNYRAQRAAWQAGVTAQPRLGYDRSVLAGNAMVTGGGARYAGR